jgi:signal transduction histidine kinase
VTTTPLRCARVYLTLFARVGVTDRAGGVVWSGGRVVAGDLPTIDADPVQMRQLFQNLIANGLKFRRAEVAPVVRVSSDVPTEGGTRADAEGRRKLCVIRIADNGIGFDEKYLDRIFDVFQRLHGRDQYEGTGIGLAVCRKIVERHGGAITAISRPGEGATFVISLPAAHREQPGDPPDVPHEPQADHDPAGR